MPIGVLTNCASVLAGGVIGSALGHILPASLKEHLPTMFKSFYHGITCFLWKYRRCANRPFLYRSNAKTAGSVKQ